MKTIAQSFGKSETRCLRNDYSMVCRSNVYSVHATAANLCRQKAHTKCQLGLQNQRVHIRYVRKVVQVRKNGVI